MTLIDPWSGFQGRDIFWHWKSHYGTSIGSHRLSIEWWHFKWPSWTPNPVFKVNCIFEVERLKNSASYGQSYYSTLIRNHNGTMFGDIDWPLNASHGFLAIAEFLVCSRWSLLCISVCALVAVCISQYIMWRKTQNLDMVDLWPACITTVQLGLSLGLLMDWTCLQSKAMGASPDSWNWKV